MVQHSDTSVKQYPPEYRRKYYSQRTMAMKRGIPWHFDMHTWIAWWGEDIDRIGRLKNCLCMARHNDEGPYHPDNVEKITVSQNHKDVDFSKAHYTTVIVDGVQYNSFADASRKTGVSSWTMRHRCRHAGWPNYSVIE